MGTTEILCLCAATALLVYAITSTIYERRVDRLNMTHEGFRKYANSLDAHHSNIHSLKARVRHYYSGLDCSWAVEIPAINPSVSPIAIRHFYYPFGNNEESDYAKMCAEELADKLNEDM